MKKTYFNRPNADILILHFTKRKRHVYWGEFYINEREDIVSHGQFEPTEKKYKVVKLMEVITKSKCNKK